MTFRMIFTIRSLLICRVLYIYIYISRASDYTLKQHNYDIYIKNSNTVT